MNDVITPALCELREAFQRHGRDIMLVGGVVRSLLLCETPADIDLCTDANPEEQQTIYEANGFKHFPTGVKHGTWTVMLQDRRVVEITSLRSETEHDGRHATMTWTRDWEADLARRDLTINAMAMGFDGQIIDPFGGQADLAQRIVRFVGSPELRISEDYLRILRFFRFHARLTGQGAYDLQTLDAITAKMAGLQRISRERIWSEIAKIIAGPYGAKTFYDIIALGIAPYIDLHVSQWTRLRGSDEYQPTRDPASLIAAYFGDQRAVLAQAATWHWSVQERDQAVFIAGILNESSFSLRDAQTLATRGTTKYWLVDALRLLGKAEEAEALIRWPIPDFPVTGADLLSSGMSESREVGATLRALRDAWDQSQFQMTKAALLELLPTVTS